MKYTVFFFFFLFFGFFKEIYENICSCPTGINPKFGFINQLLGRKWGIPPPLNILTCTCPPAQKCILKENKKIR